MNGYLRNLAAIIDVRYDFPIPGYRYDIRNRNPAKNLRTKNSQETLLFTSDYIFRNPVKKKLVKIGGNITDSVQCLSTGFSKMISPAVKRSTGCYPA
jgi:hypothetical protein